MPDFSNLPIKWEFLHALADGDETFEQDLLKLFVRDARLHLEQLAGAIETRNYQEIYEAAHYLKGASSNVGAVGIEQLAKRLEEQSQVQQLPKNISEMCEQLSNQLEQIAEYLQSKG